LLTIFPKVTTAKF